MRMDSTDKTSVRKIMIGRRDSLSEKEREEKSRQIAERLFAMEEYRKAKVVLSYASFRSEVITDEINRRVLKDGKKLYLPRTYIKEKCIRFFEVTDLKRDLKTGAMSIREPATDRPFLKDSEALVIMPGVAYDGAGNRMGYGGGYYDRFLSEHTDLSERTVFPAYTIQRAEVLPTEETDQKPKLILTESGIVCYNG